MSNSVGVEKKESYSPCSLIKRLTGSVLIRQNYSYGLEKTNRNYFDEQNWAEMHAIQMSVGVMSTIILPDAERD